MHPDHKKITGEQALHTQVRLNIQQLIHNLAASNPNGFLTPIPCATLIKSAAFSPIP